MIKKVNDTKGEKINHPDASNAIMKVLVGSTEGWSDYVMRLIILEKNGFTPKHRHTWPHINYILEGEGTLHLNGEDTSVKQGAYAMVPADALHQFKNSGDAPFKFICIVPKEGHQ